jgi:hypothetical protein
LQVAVVEDKMTTEQVVVRVDFVAQLVQLVVVGH